MVGIIALLPNTQLIHAQAPSNLFGNISIASPNAASLGKYGDYPVSYNTGLPQISIPFYTVKEGPLSLPISISYHAAGLKVMEAASSVGAGWALNAGGVITRSVVGGPDDRGYLNNNTHGHFSNYGFNSYLFDPAGGASGSDCYTFPESNIAIPADGEFMYGHRDGEPDLFFFNFGGYSGKFYFRDDRTPVIVPEEDFKIEPILEGANDNIVGFTITSPDGVKYFFGKNQNSDGNINAVETTSPYTLDNGLSSGNVISSWYLNKVKTADDKFSIDLIYLSEKYSDYAISMFPVSDWASNKHFDLVKNYIDGVRLSQVNFSNGNVKLLSVGVRTDLGQFTVKTITDMVNTESKSLDTIKITDNQSFCKNFILYHSYFQDNTTPLSSDLFSGTIVTDTKRLRLDSIKEKTCDNSIEIPPYKFSYTTPSGDFAPRRLSFGQDHWGYYNGQVNSGLIPEYTWNEVTKYAGANREANAATIAYGSLNKIDYPTGGYTQFDFEPNDVWLTYPTIIESLSTSSYTSNSVGTQWINISSVGNKYKFVLDFSGDQPGNTQARAYVDGLQLEVTRTNRHAEIIFTPTLGTQTFYLKQMDMQSATHDFATLKVYELIPQTYEGNTAVGGLRIKSIVSKSDMSGSDIATNFNYRSGLQSTGVLYSRPTYVRVLRNDILKQVGYATLPGAGNGCLTGLPDGTGVGYQKSPSSLRLMETVQGNHIGYNMVEVSKAGNGKTRYQYFGSDYGLDGNHSDVCTRNVSTTSCPTTLPNWPDAPLAFDYIRGQLNYEGYYDESGNLLKTIFYYPVYSQSPITTPGYILKSWVSTYYNLATAKKISMTTVTTDIPLTGSTLTTIDSTFYESPYHHQLTRKVSINSKGEKLETKIKYAFDFRIPNCEAISDGWQTYNTSYTSILNNFNTQLITCTNTGSCNCKWKVFQSYRYNWSLARKSYVSARRANFTDLVNSFKTAHETAKVNADTELKPILELQDEYINAPIEISNWKDGELLSASFSCFDYSSDQTNKVYPKRSQSIGLTATSASFENAKVNPSGSTLIKDNRYKEEAKYRYVSGNAVEVTAKAGITSSYLWDYNDNFQVAEAKAASYDQISYTSFESTGTGNLVYSATKIPDISSPTGNYCYSLSNGPIQRINLTSTRSYVLSFWYKKWTVVSVAAGTQSHIQESSLRNGWIFRQVEFTGSTTATISGSGYIDEVRIYPKGALMTTTIYNPLIGVTSSSDANNKITYYEYDKLNRLKNVKDHDKNIIKNYYYNYGLAPSAPPGLVTINLSNSSTGVYSLRLISKTTGQLFVYPMGFIIGGIPPINVPPDVYDILIDCNSSCPAKTAFTVCTLMSTGTNAVFYNILVSNSTCTSISVKKAK